MSKEVQFIQTYQEVYRPLILSTGRLINKYLLPVVVPLAIINTLIKLLTFIHKPRDFFALH